MMTAEQNKAVVAEVLKAIESGDPKGILAHLTDSANWWVAGDLPISGDHDRAGIEKMVAGMAAATEGPVVFNPLGYVADDHRVAVEAE